MIAKQPFGRTGHLSTRIIFGGFAVGEVTQAEADRTLDVLQQYGINHIDTAPSYGESELRIKPWLARYRQDFFLATKTLGRTYQAAKDELHRSLERMGVDSIDLWQFHYLVDPQEWEVAMGPGGCLEAAIEAREQGLIRFIGVTGHEVAIARMHLRSLERFDFDSVLLPYNYLMMQNPRYAADFEALLRICQERDVAVQTIKSLARRPSWGDEPKTHSTWYAPLTEQDAIDRAVAWVLSRPGIFLNTSGDPALLVKILDAATRFQGAPSDEAMAADVTHYTMTPIFA